MRTFDFETKQPRKKSSRPVFVVVGVALALIFGFTFASNISINSSAPVEFGKGIAVETACDHSILVTPSAQFVNSNGGGDFYLTSLEVTGIDNSEGHCKNKAFSFRFFGNSGNSTPLELNSDAESQITVQSDGTYFFDYDDNVEVQTLDNSSFVINLNSPTAKASDVKKVVVQTSAGRGTYIFGTVKASYVSSSCNTEVTINSLLSNDKKLSTGSISGYARVIVSTSSGSLRFNSYSGTTEVQGYQYPVNTSATEVALQGPTADIQNALDDLRFNPTGACPQQPIITASVVPTNSEGNISYDPANGHYYEFVNSPVNWSTAFNQITGGNISTSDDGYTRIGTYNLNRSYASCPYQFNNMCGYFVTVTSAAENQFIGLKVGANDIWYGGSDRRSSHLWVWEDDVAPEYNVAIDNSTYSHWADGEPNSYNGDLSGEPAIQTYASNDPYWNNLSEIGSHLAYIVEYGGSRADLTNIQQPLGYQVNFSLSFS